MRFRLAPLSAELLSWQRPLNPLRCFPLKTLPSLLPALIENLAEMSVLHNSASAYLANVYLGLQDLIIDDHLSSALMLQLRKFMDF